MQYRHWQREDQKVGYDVDAGVAPVDVVRMAVCRWAFRKIPECVQGDANRQDRYDDPKVRNHYDHQQYPSSHTDVVVVKRAEVQTEDRNLDEDQAEGVDDVDAKCVLQ